jgi:protein-disulfide isomerase
MPRFRSRPALAAAALLALAAGPAAAGVPADAVKGDMSLGNPKARVHVVEYASASCPHCAHFDEETFPAFRQKYVDTGRVYYTLKEFLTEPADVAAAGFLLARCGGKARYFTILDAVFRSQDQWRTTPVSQLFVSIGQANGLSEPQVEDCITDSAAAAALEARVQVAAEKDKIESTPTFVVNGKVAAQGDVPLSTLDTAIAAAESAAPRPAPRRAPHKAGSR